MLRAPHRSALALAAAIAACTSSPPAGPAPDRSVIRLSPLEVRSAPVVEGARLVDRDTTAPVAISARTSVTFRFPHEVGLRRLKAHGAVSLRISAPGLGELGAATPEGWRSATFAPSRGVKQVTVEVSPLAGDAQVDEIELWGVGEKLAPRDPQALAIATRSAAAPAFENARALRATPSEATLQPAGIDPDATCVHARFPADDPRQARRAYLAFEANVPRAVALQHSFDGEAPVGGFWLGTTADSRTLVGEVDPERLRGADDLLLCLPAEATAAVSVKDLRLLLVLDDGTDVLDRDAHRRMGAAADGDAATSAAVPAGSSELRFDRFVDVERAEIRLAAPARLRSWAKLDGSGWTQQPGLALDAAANALPLAGRAGGLALDFAGAARPDAPAANVAEISIQGSGVGRRVGGPRIVLAFPSITVRDGVEIGERFGARAFVAGWAESAAGAGTVEIEGARVDVYGAFSVPLTRSAGSTGSWTVAVKARFPDGAELSETVALDDDRSGEIAGAAPSAGSADRRFGKENQTGWGRFDPASGGRVTLGTDVVLEAPAGAVAAATSVGITRKSHEALPELDAGMVNVTAPAHSAYRFLPKGQKFAVPVTLRLPYDPDLLPEGVAPEEIRTFYFDEDERRWVALPRKEVRRTTNQVVSETTHFTFMINAVLVLPDHPGPVSFNPTSIKDLKAADPSSGIDLVEPPQPGNDGAARVSFPIRLPKARGAYQPALTIAYDSSGGDGWLGVGWDLALPSVTLDTRYGVPDYDGEERYLLGGEQLVPADPSPYGAGTCLDGAHARKYVARVEREFREILRCGDDPPRYWFQVADKSGTLFVYGRDPNARLTSYIPRVTDPPVFPPVYDVGQWFLQRVVDVNGNLTELGYQHDSKALGAPEHAEDFRHAYLRSIRYTGHTTRTGAGAVEGGDSGPYLVELFHEAGSRSDEITSGRLGFKTVVRRRLGRIAVSLLAGSPSGAIRSYALSYEIGDFGKSRLRSVDLLGTDGSRFYGHTFEYESRAPVDADGVDAFSGPQEWLANAADYGTSGSDEWSAGFHGFFGIGLGPMKSEGTIGVGFGFNHREQTTLVTTVDLNGDGLPDRVYARPDLAGGYAVYLNQGPGRAMSPAPPAGDPAARAQIGAVTWDPGARNLGKESGNSVDAALQIFGGPFTLNFGGSYSVSKSKDLVLDANGDGLPDIVNGGKVWFNQPRHADCPPGAPPQVCCPAGTFCFEQSLPVPALTDLGDSADLVQNDATLAKGNEAVQDATTPEDAVLEWTVPYSGRVDISGALSYADVPPTGARHDGVRLTVYQVDPFAQPPPDAPPGWTPPAVQLARVFKAPSDTTATAVDVPSVAVTAGQTLYFVVSTLGEMPVNDATGALSPLEEVRYAPVITYLGTTAAERSRLDPSGEFMFRFDAARDFVLAGDPPGSVTMPRDGKAHLDLTFDKDATSDDVRVCVTYFDQKDAPSSPPPCRASDPANVFYQSFDAARVERGLSLAVADPVVEVGGRFFFRMDTDVAIRPQSVRWSIAGRMSCVNDPAQGCRAPTPQEAPSLAFRAQPYFTLHDDRLVDLGNVWRPSGQPMAPWVAPEDGSVVCGSAAPFAHPAVFFSVRTQNQKIIKWAGTHGSVGGAAAVRAGDPVFFEAHAESAAALRFLFGAYPSWSVGCTFTSADGKRSGSVSSRKEFTTDRHVDALGGGNSPLLAGGHRGWRYGAWQGANEAAFEGWVYRGPPDDGSWKDQSSIDANKKKMKNKDDPQRRRLRLVGLAVPSPAGTEFQPGQPGLLPEVPAYVTQDGNAFFAAGVMHAGRRGQSTNNVQQSPSGEVVAASPLRIDGLGRTSTAVNLTAGLGLSFLNLSVSTGFSQQKTDVMDLNGDRIVDVVAAGGIPDVTGLDFGAILGLLNGDGLKTDLRITDPVTLGTKRVIRLPTLPRLNTDLSAQFGLGASEPVKLLMAKLGIRGVAGRLPSLNGGIGVNVGTTVEDLVDVNGDGLPDAVRRNNPSCPDGFSVRLNLGTSFAAQEDCIVTPAWDVRVQDGLSDRLGGDPAVQNPSDDPDTEQSRGITQGILAGGPLRRTNAMSVNGSIGAGFAQVLDGLGGTIVDEQFGVSVSMESSLAATNFALVDINGDGLPDYVFKGNAGTDFIVMVNTGYGFAPPRSWRPAGSWYDRPGARPARLRLLGADELRDLYSFFLGDQIQGIDPIEATGTHSAAPSVGVAVDFAFSLLLGAPPWFHIGVGFNASPSKITGFELALQDIDGDGLPDHVLKTGENQSIWVRLNKLQKANLLRRVVRPLGGSFDIAYARSGNTVDMPQNQWVVDSVTVHDGVGSGTGHDFLTSYGFLDGKHDRIEREFLGFATVIRTNPDQSRVVQRFKNDSILVKGLLESEKTVTGDPQHEVLWTETVVTFSDPAPLLAARSECKDRTPILLVADSYCGSFFGPVHTVEKRFYEGAPQAGIVTRERFRYNGNGDVIGFDDEGDAADPADDLSATIEYAVDDASTLLHSVTRPQSVVVTDSSGRVLRSRSATYYTDTGNLKDHSALVADNKIAVTHLEWEPDTGNLHKVTGPANYRGDSYTTQYGYDAVTRTYLETIIDAHGFTSSAKYDTRFGEAIETTDENGNTTARRMDAFGRVERIAGPYDTLASPTVQMIYAPSRSPAYAWTKNRLPRRPNDRRGTVDTVMVLDGIGRLIQTKKSAEIATGDTTKGVGWVVTGHQEFDEMGRVAVRGQGFAQFSARPEYVPGTPRNPTLLRYDVLGRMVQMVEPNAAITRIEHGFGTPAGTITNRFRAVTTDAEGHSRAAYEDPARRIVASEERIEGRTPTTLYRYNPVGDLLAVTDAAGNATTATYDLVGRRTSVSSADLGRIELEYDLAGNLRHKVDSNLRSGGSAITYDYDVNLLTDVRYPTATRNVHYVYGKADADRSINGIGRIIEVRDEAGTENRAYGALGEIVSTTRKLDPIRPGDRPRTFTTSFSFDSFGRMMTITYPDGETVEYGYDAGGMLESATGHRPATAKTPKQDEAYLTSLSYDEFGQRSRMVLGNGTVTTHSYEPLTRRLHRLYTVTPLSRTLQDVTYSYDRVGNVVATLNALGEPVHDRSGQVSLHYRYDELYRLVWAHGEAKSRPHTVDTFTATYQYSDIHNMDVNRQVHEVIHGDGSGGSDFPPKTNHDFAYAYSGAGPHQATRIGDTLLVYDANGNTVRECRDQGDPTCTSTSVQLWRYSWTEENRLAEAIHAGGRDVTKFLYDAAGQRLVKLGRGGESITIGQFWALKGRRAATKHIFAGTTRLASKLLPPPGWDDVPRGPSGGGTTVGDGSPNTNGCDPSNYQPDKCPVLPGGDPVVNDVYADTRVRPETYYYHPDHLGSTSWVTDQNGRVHEHVEYFPYGEVWRDPRSDADGAPVKGQRFLFTSKELDEETGLYYFGARYYDPRRARWMSADPASIHYLDGAPAGGVFRPTNLSAYGYAALNPIGLLDPDGGADKPARAQFINDALASDAVLLEVIKASPNFSQQAFEDAFNRGGLSSFKEGSGATLFGLAGEAIALESLRTVAPAMPQPSILAGVAPDLIQTLPSGRANIRIPVFDIEIRRHYTMPAAIDASGRMGERDLGTNNQFALYEVKTGMSQTNLRKGVTQTVAAAAALSKLKMPGVAVLMVDEAVWRSLTPTMQQKYYKQLDAAGAFLQVQPGLGRMAEERARDMIREAEQRKASSP